MFRPAFCRRTLSSRHTTLACEQRGKILSANPTTMATSMTQRRLLALQRPSLALHSLHRSYHTSRVFFSSRLLGHSPMAPAGPTSPNSPDNNAIPTAKDVTTAGGVWAPTSAKRDKLGELLAALEENERTLDDVATPEQKHDLWLCDGITSIVTSVDYNQLLSEKENVGETATKIMDNLDSWWGSKVPESSQGLGQIQFENILEGYSKEIDHHLAAFPPELHLRDVRDFFDVNELNNKNPKFKLPIPEEGDAATASLAPLDTMDTFQAAALRYRLLLAQAAAQKMQSSWQKFTKVSDQDVDRAAVKGDGQSSLKVGTLPAEKVQAILLAFLKGNASGRVDAIWDLLDRDQDTRLDEIEVNEVVELSIDPVRQALERIFTEATEASLVRPSGLVGANDAPETPPEDKPTLPWRKRRAEAREKKRILKTLKKTLKRHFTDEVEQSHRLRCIYAWANKVHQDNAIDSVLVENEEIIAGFAGRKRYVELHPKISIEEFREVQRVHFTHLDRVGAEFMKSFREDLWVIQGTGRQNRELLRDCGIFMAVVCAVDLAIILV